MISEQEQLDRNLARDILQALNPGELAAVLRPEKPNFAGLTESAAAARRAEYATAHGNYISYLLSKPSSALTTQEQKDLLLAVADWSREGR